MAAIAAAKLAAQEAAAVDAAEEKARFDAEEKNRRKLQKKAEAEEPNHVPTLALILINPNTYYKTIPDSRRNRRTNSKPRKIVRFRPFRILTETVNLSVTATQNPNP